MSEEKNKPLVVKEITVKSANLPEPIKFKLLKIEGFETDLPFYFETEYLYSPKDNNHFEYTMVNYADTLEKAQQLAQLYIAEMSEPIQKNKDY